MNRQTKRIAQRQDPSEGNGAAAVMPRPLAPSRPAPAPQRTTPAGFVRDVRGELRKVAWPNRSEVANYSIVVFITLVLLIAMIFALNYGFAKGVLFLFGS